MTSNTSGRTIDMTASVTRNLVILLTVCAFGAGGAVLCSTVAAPNDTKPPMGAGVTQPDGRGFDTSVQPATATDAARLGRQNIYPTATTESEASP
jgi:hypothetical protein